MGELSREARFAIDAVGLIGSLPVLAIIYFHGQCLEGHQSAAEFAFMLFMYTQLPLLFLLPHHWMLKLFALCVVAALWFLNLAWSMHTLQNLRTVACSKVVTKGLGVSWGLVEWTAAPINALLLIYLPIKAALRAYQKRSLANE